MSALARVELAVDATLEKSEYKSGVAILPRNLSSWSSASSGTERLPARTWSPSTDRLISDDLSLS